MIWIVFTICLAVDGDTLRCRTTPEARAQIASIAPRRVMRRWRGRAPASIRIRLKGINTPERCEAGYQRARDALMAMVRRQSVRCRYERSWTWRRPVMTCFVNGQDVGRRMIRLGLAQACRQHGGRRYDANARRCIFVRCGRRR